VAAEEEAEEDVGNPISKLCRSRRNSTGPDQGGGIVDRNGRIQEPGGFRTTRK
jgi:hypothetical protein